MTTDDFIKLYDENQKNTASRNLCEDSIDISKLEDELNNATFDENIKPKSKPIQTSPNQSKPIQTSPNQSKPVQTYPN